MAVMDSHEYAQQQETPALLNLLAMNHQESDAGHYHIQMTDAFFSDMLCHSSE